VFTFVTPRHLISHRRVNVRSTRRYLYGVRVRRERDQQAVVAEHLASVANGTTEVLEAVADRWLDGCMVDVERKDSKTVIQNLPPA